MSSKKDKKNVKKIVKKYENKALLLELGLIVNSSIYNYSFNYLMFLFIVINWQNQISHATCKIAMLLQGLLTWNKRLPYGLIWFLCNVLPPKLQILKCNSPGVCEDEFNVLISQKTKTIPRGLHDHSFKHSNDACNLKKKYSWFKT